MIASLNPFRVSVDGVMQVLTERRAREISNLPPLPDLGHSILPYIHWYKLNDLYIALCLLAFLLRFVSYPTLRIKMLRRFLFLEAVILLFRGISVVLTTLSIPLRDCVSDAVGNPFIESLYILIYVHHTCADLVTTNHTLPCLACTTSIVSELAVIHVGRSIRLIICAVVLWPYSNVHADSALLDTLLERTGMESMRHQSVIHNTPYHLPK